jgi:putative transposase
VLDTGEKKDNPYFFQTAKPKLKKLYQVADRKKHKRGEKNIKPSKRYQKSQLEIGKVSEKVANQRKDFVFKEVKKLTDNYDFFGVEKFQASKIVEKEKRENK